MLSKMSKENLEMLSYAKIAELYLKENKKPMNCFLPSLFSLC